MHDYAISIVRGLDWRLVRVDWWILHLRVPGRWNVRVCFPPRRGSIRIMSLGVLLA